MATKLAVAIGAEVFVFTTDKDSKAVWFSPGFTGTSDTLLVSGEGV